MNNNKIYLAHGLDKTEIGKYDFVYSNDYFSIAMYFNSNNDKLLEFSHSHSEYEFIFPLGTIPILVYDKALYVGEVGYCYPVNPFVNHGIGMNLDSKVISIAFDKDYFDKIKEELGKKDKYFYTRFLIEKDLLLIIQQFYLTRNSNLIEKIATYLINDGLEEDIDRRKKPYSYFPYIKDSIIRISKARELIDGTNKSLLEISKQVGYNRSSKFCEAFKRITGVKPNDYKRKMRKQNIDD